MELAISKHFGFELMTSIQQEIIEKWCGEQPVGTSLIVPIFPSRYCNNYKEENKNKNKCKWLAHTPTMRGPEDIKGTDHPYVAMWAALIAIHQHNKLTLNVESQIRSVACVGLGCGIGNVTPESCAKQMALAWQNYQNRLLLSTALCRRAQNTNIDNEDYLIYWDDVTKRQCEINTATSL